MEGLCRFSLLLDRQLAYGVKILIRLSNFSAPEVESKRRLVVVIGAFEKLADLNNHPGFQR